MKNVKVLGSGCRNCEVTAKAIAKVDLTLAAVLIVVGAAGSFLGARITSL